MQTFAYTFCLTKTNLPSLDVGDTVHVFLNNESGRIQLYTQFKHDQNFVWLGVQHKQFKHHLSEDSLDRELKELEAMMKHVRSISKQHVFINVLCVLFAISLRQKKRKK